VVALSMLVLGATACGSSSRPAGSSVAPVTTTVVGLRVDGVVQASPTCPVERPGQICAPAAVAGTVQAKRSGSVIASTTTDAAGAFTLTLSPGSYELDVDTHAALPRCTPLDIEVVATTLKVTISCDSGMR